MSALECAAGVCRIVELNMADIIRKVTVEKGFDPRDFVLFAFGGAGPAHAGVFAAELGVKRVIVPQRKAGLGLVRVRRGCGRRAAHLRAQRDPRNAGRSGEESIE
jgi:N-methylhydantoinase A/oxoprolinase/acetone carboxylase beta subunit